MSTERTQVPVQDTKNDVSVRFVDTAVGSGAGADMHRSYTDPHRLVPMCIARHHAASAPQTHNPHAQTPRLGTAGHACAGKVSSRPKMRG
jgi:hypothetical protein